MAIDIEINTLRDWSTTSSTNSSRATSVYLDVFSTIYIEYVQALTNNSTYAN